MYKVAKRIKRSLNRIRRGTRPYRRAAASAGALVAAASLAGRRTPSKIRLPVTPSTGTSSAARTLFGVTNTMTRTRRRRSNIEKSTHNDMTDHVMKGTVMRGKKYKGRLGNTMRYQENYNHVINVAQGRQSSDTLEHVFNYAKLHGDTNAARSNNSRSVFDFLWGLEVNKPITNLNEQTIPNPVQNAVFIDHAINQFKFLNMQNVPIKCELLLITPKFDTSVDPLTNWGNGTEYDAFGKPSYVAQSTYGQTGSTPGQPSRFVVGEKPYMHKEWNRCWRILRKKEFILQPGDQRNYKWYLEYKRVCFRENLVTRAGQYMANWTVIPVLIAHGGLVGLAPNAESATGEVGYAGLKLGVVQEINYKLRGIPLPKYHTRLIEENLLVEQAGTVQKLINDEDMEDDLEQL